MTEFGLKGFRRWWVCFDLAKSLFPLLKESVFCWTCLIRTKNVKICLNQSVRIKSRINIQTVTSCVCPNLSPVLWWWWWWWWRWWWAEMWTCWARTSASLPLAAPLPPLRVEEEEEEAVEEVVVVVEEVPWIARLIQCSMLMLPSRLDEVPPPPPPSSSSQSPPSSSSP